MIVRCYGARGSVPTSGNEFSKYGGNTTCMQIESNEKDIIVVDAGSGIRPLGEELNTRNIETIHLFFTHYHLDHIIGFPFFKPLFNKKIKIKIYGPRFLGKSLRHILDNFFIPPYFPINPYDICAGENLEYINIDEDEDYNIDNFKITTIRLNHPNGGLGYRFVEKNKSFVFLTDNELDHKHFNDFDYNKYVEFSKNADLLIHDSEYSDEEYKFTKGWGHTTFKSAFEFAKKCKVKRFGLFHHNQKRSDNDLEEIVNNMKDNIRQSEMEMECFAPSQNYEIEL